MVNTAKAYKELGASTARARRKHDEALAQLNRRHLYKMLAMENPEDHEFAHELYDEGYREEIRP